MQASTLLKRLRLSHLVPPAVGLATANGTRSTPISINSGNPNTSKLCYQHIERVHGNGWLARPMEHHVAAFSVAREAGSYIHC